MPIGAAAGVWCAQLPDDGTMLGKAAMETSKHLGAKPPRNGDTNFFLLRVENPHEKNELTQVG